MRINANSHASSRLCMWERDLYPLSPLLLLRPAEDRGQYPPEVPDDRLTNAEGLLPDLVNSLEDTAATGRPNRVVHHGSSVDGTTHSHCIRPDWFGGET